LAKLSLTAGHRLVIEARDDMQVGMEPALIVPAERIAVGSEPLLDVQVRLAQHVVIAKDAAIGHRTVLLGKRSKIPTLILL
jgi:hypothetical protein